MPPTDEAMPSDPSLSAVLAHLEVDGYRSQFVPQGGGVLRCTRGGHVFSASSARPDSSRRLEGVSDPADMMLVYAMRCPVCSIAGTVVLHYGPEASPEEADVLVAIEPPDVHDSGVGGTD